MKMNKTIKNKALSPSPQSQNARKPFINITSIVNNSSEYPQGQKNYRSRISVDDCSRPKIKIVHSRKNDRPESSNSNKQKKSQHKSQFQCRIHSNRKATHEIVGSLQQYLCFQCSLLWAKRGMKVREIKKQLQKNVCNSELIRGKQTRQYLEKCNATEKQLKKWYCEKVKKEEEIVEEFNVLIQKQRVLLKEQIARVQSVYGKHIEMLQEKRDQKVKSYEEAKEQIQMMIKSLGEIQSDIEMNLEECVREFSETEFREIMNEYWKILEEAETCLASNTKIQIGKDSELENTLNSLHITKKGKDSQFTFSKQSRFETPPLQKTFKGIKQVESYGLTGSSGLKQSIVDHRFCFHDVNPFIA